MPWVEKGQVYSILLTDDQGMVVMLGPGTQRRITWEEAARLHAEDPDNTGLFHYHFVQPGLVVVER